MSSYMSAQEHCLRSIFMNVESWPSYKRRLKQAWKDLQVRCNPNVRSIIAMVITLDKLKISYGISTK